MYETLIKTRKIKYIHKYRSDNGKIWAIRKVNLGWRGVFPMFLSRRPNPLYEVSLSLHCKTWKRCKWHTNFKTWHEANSFARKELEANGNTRLIK